MNSHNLVLTVRSYAKINLTLDILGKRPDGFHDIESVMQSINLHDTLTLTTRRDTEIRVTCNVPGIPINERNLAYKAADILFNSYGVAGGIDIHIEKRIPAEAGLGGGSSNAAVVIRILNRMLGLNKGIGELCRLGAEIGSDVPFFILGGTAFVRGRGEIVQPLPDICKFGLVIVKPPFGISTPLAYSRLDELSDREHNCFSRRMLECIENAKCGELPEVFGNDLELPAVELHPEILNIKNELVRSGARGALMCGSGSAVFGLFGDYEEASSAANRFEGSGEIFVAETLGREEADRF